MADAARVQSVESLQRFRLALMHFNDHARAALDEIESDVQRTAAWLRDDQMRYWKHQLKQRQTAVENAHAVLQHARSSTMKPSSQMERSAYERAVRMVREAEEKLVRRRQWLRVLEHDLQPEISHCRNLSERLGGDLPRALARLTRMVDNLDDYVSMKPPPAASTEST